MLEKDYTLGELQATYTGLLRAYADYQFFWEFDYHQQQIQAIEKQIAIYQQLLTQAEVDTNNLQLQIAKLQKSHLDLQRQYQAQKR